MKFAYLIEPPFNHRTSEGIVTGTDVELARVIVDELKLGEFQPVEAEFADLLPGVASRKWQRPHREMMHSFGFCDTEIDMVVEAYD